MVRSRTPNVGIPALPSSEEALAVLRRYDTLSLEDVRVAKLVRNRHLAKSISDAGWAQFHSIRWPSSRRNAARFYQPGV